MIGGCCVTSGGGVVPISMSLGGGCVRWGALKILRPVKAPPNRLLSEPRATGGRAGGAAGSGAASVAELGCVLAARALRARMRLMCRSRRTMAFVILTGQAPVGNTLCLHMGHNDEWFRRKVSIHSGWNTW